RARSGVQADPRGTMIMKGGARMRGSFWWAIGALFALFALACTPDGGGEKSKDPPATSATAAIEKASPPPAATPALAPIKPLDPGKSLQIGVTLHPYCSWTKSLVGDAPGVEVRSILPGEVDAGNYQPRPEDIKKIS